VQGALAFAIPNGGARSEGEASIVASLSVASGVHDWSAHFTEIN
jgi:hypothetical protein